jgi:hypothetical protein
LCVGSSGKFRLLTAQQFERAVGEVGGRLIHRATLMRGGRGRIYPS